MNSAISIIVITYNEANRIGHLLDDLVKQAHPNMEVIVVDSCSTDDTVAIARGFQSQLADLKIVEMDDRGVSLGRNVGAEHASHERIVFLDADVRISAHFIRDSVNTLQQKGLKIAGGRMQSTAASPMIRWGIRSFDLGMCATQLFFPTAVGACIFSTRTLHQDIGGFDQRIKLCEDCDYVKRASRSYRFRMLPVFFEFDARRLEQDGLFKTGMTYLKANVYRIFFGELIHNPFDYKFGHYEKAASSD